MRQLKTKQEEIIYINYINIETGNTCFNVLNFELKITNLNPGTAEDFTACESDLSVDIISQVSGQILNNLNPPDFSLSYFLTETDAQNNVSEIENPSNFILPLAPASITIWVRFIELNNPNCFEIISFQIFNYSSPRVDLLEDVYECDSYILPELTDGKYFTEPGGNGIELFAGDIITENTTIYIYNINTEGCFNESSFNIFLATLAGLAITIPSYNNVSVLLIFLNVTWYFSSILSILSTLQFLYRVTLESNFSEMLAIPFLKV